MKRIYTYLSVKFNIHVHVEINFKHLNTYVQGDICSHTELLISIEKIFWIVGKHIANTIPQGNGLPSKLDSRSENIYQDKYFWIY